jgi:hypothetical protein
MEIRKLKSALKSQTALLSVNAAIFGSLLALTGNSHSYWWGFLYVGYASYAYLRFLKSGASKPVSLFVIFISLALAAALAAGNGASLAVIVLAASALLFVFLGGQTLFFSNFRAALSVFYHSVMFGVAAYFASIAPFELWWGSIPLLFLVFYVSTGDYIKAETSGYDRRKKIYALIFSLIASQCVWLASLLPFGFLNAGALLIVFSITVNDLFLAHLFGKLGRKTLLRNLAFFGIFTVLIFMAGSL